VSRFLWLVFVLILVFLVLAPGTGVKQIINSLSAFSVKGIMALQGRFTPRGDH
jgi:hypothetical protein